MEKQDDTDVLEKQKHRDTPQQEGIKKNDEYQDDWEKNSQEDKGHTPDLPSSETKEDQDLDISKEKVVVHEAFERKQLAESTEVLVPEEKTSSSNIPDVSSTALPQVESLDTPQGTTEPDEIVQPSEPIIDEAPHESSLDPHAPSKPNIQLDLLQTDLNILEGIVNQTIVDQTQDNVREEMAFLDHDTNVLYSTIQTLKRQLFFERQKRKDEHQERKKLQKTLEETQTRVAQLNRNRHALKHLLASSQGTEAALSFQSERLLTNVEHHKQDASVAKDSTKQLSALLVQRENQLRHLTQDNQLLTRELDQLKTHFVDEKLEKADLIRETKLSRAKALETLKTLDREHQAHIEVVAKREDKLREIQKELGQTQKRVQMVLSRANVEKQRFVDVILRLQLEQKQLREQFVKDTQASKEEVISSERKSHGITMQRFMDENQQLRVRSMGLEREIESMREQVFLLDDHHRSPSRDNTTTTTVAVPQPVNSNTNGATNNGIRRKLSRRTLFPEGTLSSAAANFNASNAMTPPSQSLSQSTSPSSIEVISLRSQIGELENLLRHSREQQDRYVKLLKTAEDTIQYIMNEKQVQTLTELTQPIVLPQMTQNHSSQPLSASSTSSAGSASPRKQAFRKPQYQKGGGATSPRKMIKDKGRRSETMTSLEVAQKQSAAEYQLRITELETQLEEKQKLLLVTFDEKFNLMSSSSSSS